MADRFRYRAIPFHAEVKTGQPLAAATKQLESILHELSGQGWEFYQQVDLEVEVVQGCLFGIFKSTAKSLVIRHLVFRQPAG